MLSPCPPKTRLFIFFTGTFNSCDKKYLNLDESNIPAIPTTLFVGKLEYFCKAITITSKGLVIQITNAFGEFCLIPLATCFIIFKFVSNKSSLDMPGFLEIPAVTITTSEFLISSYLLEPVNFTLSPSTEVDCAISKALPFAKPSATSNRTTSANSFIVIK